MTAEFTSRVWVSEATHYRFEEIESRRVAPKLGICFSGGGTRAMSAAMGQLRAVSALGAMAGVDYISCVSGGSWAATIFTYAQKGESDEALLERAEPPEAITRQSLCAPMPETCLGFGATRNFLCAVVGSLCQCLEGVLSPDRIWIDAVGRTFFSPFGIDDAAAPRYFAPDLETVARIVAVNPSLSRTDFLTIRRKDRPFLVINSAMVGPAGKTDRAGLLGKGIFPDPVGFEYTPLYVGSPAENRRAFSRFGLGVGNGFIEPFAFGGEAPSGPVSPDGTQRLPAPHRPFTLTDASGTSSAAYGYTVAVLDHLLWFSRSVEEDLLRIRARALDAGAVSPEAVRERKMALAGEPETFFGPALDLLANIRDCVEKAGILSWPEFLYQLLKQAETILDNLLPCRPCWPVCSGGGQEGADFEFTDGGNMENFGIISLLLRKVAKIVVYINTSTRIKPDKVFDGAGKVDFSSIDSTLASLFGYAPEGLHQITGNLGFNQVFDPGDLKEVVADFNDCIEAGRAPLVSVRTHTIRAPAENWWGVENGRRVRVCWVYLNTPGNWYNALSSPVRAMMAEPGFADFPFYKTIGEDEGQLVRLSLAQVRLLAHMTCWTTLNSKAIREMFVS